MQFLQINSVFASKEKNKEQIITCGISKQVCVELQLSSCHLKNGKFAYLHQDATDWTFVPLGYLGGLGSYDTEMSP